MFPIVSASAAPSSAGQLNLLVLLGFAILSGTAGARLFERLRIPQVVGYIAVGLLIGESGFKLIPHDTVAALRPLNYFALGLIGFIVGGELRLDSFKKRGKGVLAILLGEGIGAFAAVAVLATPIAYVFIGEASTALAVGIVLAAIAVATDPASTARTLWEYRTRGPVTSMLIAVVALDDALALILYALGTSIAGALLGLSGSGFLASLGRVAFELLAAVVCGAVTALGLRLLLGWSRDHDKALTFSIGSVLAAIGLAVAAGLDIILVAMTLGCTLVNLAPRRSIDTFDLVKKFIPPVYALFFVFVGARLSILHMANWIWLLAAAYVVGRSAGKVIGARFGARRGGAPRSVQSHLGMCLFSQAGVAVGLSIMASQRFPSHVGEIIVTTIAATTVILQLGGPAFIKAAARRAGEIGRNVTEEDLIESYTVGDVMDASPPVLEEDASLAKILEVFGANRYLHYPVVTSSGRLAGLVSIDELKDTLSHSELTPLLVAGDLMEPVVASVTPEAPLRGAVDRMRALRLACMPVVATSDGGKLVGFLEGRRLEARLAEEVLERTSVDGASA